ncbi:C40 family peptidase [Streptomyces sp. V3I7]|uniref:C40 family peptidase n=1 Tax=Streptomyces sp. V3I7 TaxID=3042278 RepID=UPI0027877CFD|nr:C40 family peptidase [Streptomyces sp. V3I7]MDQ0994563.1 cell wall-associated NlpC family hydrolase [Streptomyces sp. V3I7]
MAPESHDEVRQRVDALYDRAESDTGNYNATRVKASRSRTRGAPRGDGRGAGDPALDDLTRKWFDAARATRGPIVAAVLPADRMPRRAAVSRPPAPGRPEVGPVELELPAPRPMLELPAGASDRPVAELPARPVPELPAAPEPARASPATSKERNRGKLTAARELLSRYAVPQIPPLPPLPPVPDPDPDPAAIEFPPLPGTVPNLLETVPGAAPAPAPVVVTTAGTLPTYHDKAMTAVAFARAQVGLPCVWGASGPGSYDHVGLMQAAWRAAGVVLPRSTQGQAAAGTPVELSAIREGDLVLFFEDDSHVGLYVGDGLMIHAPGPGALIREESIFGAGASAIHRVVRPA